MKHFLRVVRFDSSDDHVFANSAQADEFAVSGAFEFSDISEDQLKGKTRQAFANGFLGLSSYGRATFVTVSEVTEDDLDGIIEAMAQYFVSHYGAPNIEVAREAARDETAFVEDLCKGNLINTIFAVSRNLDDAGIHEEFRIIKPPTDGIHARIWNVVEDNG